MHVSAPLFFPVSSTAVLMTVGSRIDVSLTRRIAGFVALLDGEEMPGIIEVIPSYTTILIEHECLIAEDRLRSILERLWVASHDQADVLKSRIIEIPVCYGDGYGEDLADVAAHTGLSPDDVIKRHVSATYTVGALGFSPGFAYLIGLPPELATPRRARPRLSVPPGSLGIGGTQTGIYAVSSPGGWSLIGQTPEQLFDPKSDDPFTLRMSDEVRFRRISNAEFVSLSPVAGLSSRTGRGDLDVIVSGMQTTVQDLGRTGYGRFGIARNGAADRASLIAANRLVGNPDDAAALEVTITGPHLRFRRRMQIALAGADLGACLNGAWLTPGSRAIVIPGDELTFASGESTSGARAYLAAGGGLDVPEMMGSRSTDLTAGLGGLHGRALQPGDLLRVGIQERRLVAPRVPVNRSSRRSIRVVRGPQSDRFASRTWKTFVTSAFTVTPESNRVGIRLSGPALSPEDSADIISEGIVTGSIQVTGEGQPIVMLPGHATIGGYTKIATVIEDDLDRLGQLRPGDTVRFYEASDDPESKWALGDMLRLARVVSASVVEEFAFEDHRTGAGLRLRRGG